MADNFFGEQTERSRVKVEIVCKYFPAWAKVMIGAQKRFGGTRIGYIDLYAGAGMYANGAKSTPVRIIEHAIATPDVRDRLVSMFNDKDATTTSALKKALEELPGHYIRRLQQIAVGIFLAGLSGVLAAGQLGLEPTMGTGLLMPSFIAIIVGGVGSLTGTLLGGLLIGVASGLTAMFFPAASEAIMYVLMAVVLLVRPRGLLGEEGMMT